MPVNHLALVVDTRRAAPGEAGEVAAALQRQISRDFGPIWDVEGTVDAFRSLDEVPPGYWPVIVRDNLPIKGAIGIHLDNRGQPYSLVRSVPYWPFVASHEALEMLADPFGNRVVPGGSLKPGQGIVDFIIEPCDPCGSPMFGYTVNGILLSDFVTPNYYHDPVTVPGQRYSFTGAVERPRSVLRDGYVAWREPTSREWWRAERVGSPRLRFRSLGTLEFNGSPLREQIDDVPALPFLYEGLPDDDPAVQKARIRYRSSRAASLANAAALEDRIATITGSAPTRVQGMPSGGSGMPWPGPPPPPLLPTPAAVPPPAARPGPSVQLQVANFADALDFYRDAFNADIVFERSGTSDWPGRVAQLVIADTAFWMSEDLPLSADVRSAASGSGTALVRLVVDDPEAWLQRAVLTGATLLDPVIDHGDWVEGWIKDPFGHLWLIGAPHLPWPPGP